MQRFYGSGVLELGDKLGPVNWQLAPTKQFQAEDFAAFLALLPKKAGGRALRHAVELRHPSFRHPEAVAITRRHGVAIVVAGDSEYPQIADPTAPFVYARIMGTTADHEAGYVPAALDTWAARARLGRRRAAGRPRMRRAAAEGAAGPREVFLYVISGHKVRNPAAAMALIARLGG